MYNIRRAIDKTSNMDYSTGQELSIYSSNLMVSKSKNQQKMTSTNYLKTTGILDAYENIVQTMIENGWPSN